MLIQHLLHSLGIDDTSGQFYAFWSGFGSDLGEIVLIGGLYSILKHHNCHVKGCWRVGRHEVQGTPYKVCRVHHPDIPQDITHEHIVLAYNKAKGVK